MVLDRWVMVLLQVADADIAVQVLDCAMEEEWVQGA
jgi:hypothetical protein